MSKFICVLLLLLYVGTETQQKSILIECPSNCDCDLFQGLRRARCVNGKMLHVLGNIPNYTEVLEFTYNYVSELKYHELLDSGLAPLKVANFSHNRIKEIHIYSFEGMSKLQILDLSHNALQFILPEWFWPLSSLKELYMNNNNVRELGYRPIFTSPTLRLLNLAYCQIPHLENTTFSELPNLRELDISGNYLNEIYEDVLKPCQKLTRVKLKNNRIECDNVGMFFTAYCLENEIQIDGDFCKKTEAIKMENDESAEEEVANKSETRKVWIYEIEEDFSEEEYNPEINERDRVEKNFIIGIIEMSPVISIAVLLTLGFTFGLIVGCSCGINSGRKRKSKQTQGRKTLNRRCSFIRSKSLNPLISENLIENIYADVHSTPIVLRRNFDEVVYN